MNKLIILVMGRYTRILCLTLVRLKNLAQHFGILGGILKEGVRDGKWEVSAVRVV
jgi:hypothetical protein